ncbi:hypothetical protein CQW23_16907 [Capsicum baccatum]|uniref:Uncharacterized protein n=1 Tax=Capsicum baccatum TaxID=33114 RepID=A0A2G2WCF8_CAPBA|nr:hypothetical protein CQW23_16907 [Capsicum baccatum]
MGWTIDDIIGDSPGKRMSHFEKDRMPTALGLRISYGIDYAAHMSLNAIDYAPHSVQWNLKRDKARRRLPLPKRARKEAARSKENPPRCKTPRLTLGIKWDTYEELLRMTTLMMIPMQGDIQCNGPLENKMVCNGPLSNEIICNGPLENEVICNGPLSNEMICNGPIGNEMVYNGTLGNEMVCKGLFGNEMICNIPLGNEVICNGPLGNKILFNDPLGNGIKWPS